MIRQDIQGLRALAVLAVLAGHACPNIISGGYVGVDIFFVISGFLISNIIIRGLEDGQFSILDFYRRRIQRILPALSVVVMTTVGVGFFILSPTAYRELARNVVSTMLFISNYDFWRLTGYFDGAAELKPLLHTWSLSVEAQFYILLPAFIMLIWRRLNKRSIGFVLALLSAASLASAEFLYAYSSPSAAYFFSPSRAFELLLGAIVSTGVLPPIKRANIRSILSVVGLCLILAAVVLYSSVTPFPGVTALVPCLGAALIIYTGPTARKSVVDRVLSNPASQIIGDFSY